MLPLDYRHHIDYHKQFVLDKVRLHNLVEDLLVIVYKDLVLRLLLDTTNHLATLLHKLG